MKNNFSLTLQTASSALDRAFCSINNLLALQTHASNAALTARAAKQLPHLADPPSGCVDCARYENNFAHLALARSALGPRCSENNSPLPCNPATSALTAAGTKTHKDTDNSSLSRYGEPG
jgi:hypothetical protein